MTTAVGEEGGLGRRHFRETIASVIPYGFSVLEQFLAGAD